VEEWEGVRIAIIEAATVKEGVEGDVAIGRKYFVIRSGRSEDVERWDVMELVRALRRRDSGEKDESREGGGGGDAGTSNVDI
jgi:hypothetical protein